MRSQNKQVSIKTLGCLAYQAAWTIQETLFREIVEIKLENRKLYTSHQNPTPGYLLFCEHPHVYTLGRNGVATHLLASEATLQVQGVSFYRTNRGGDITYHGPGQLVVYPILDLENFFMDIHRYLRLLEEAVMATLRDFGLWGGRIQGLTGVWLDHTDSTRARKICALGVRTSRWVTMHGLALNVNTDLCYFDQIIPCGIQGKKVTSMAEALGTEQDLKSVAQKLERHVVHLFGMERVSY
ncbi:MAG: lipoyl(octanoyl) transferase LipB [Amoebophilaceae bacterium]|jgi:lipoyl(octanoyl) transferase|nr:lipoyl(octanoyl) transferase LipB [Amoebophilaceae bacterium]